MNNMEPKPGVLRKYLMGNLPDNLMVAIDQLVKENEEWGQQLDLAKRALLEELKEVPDAQKSLDQLLQETRDMKSKKKDERKGSC